MISAKLLERGFKIITWGSLIVNIIGMAMIVAGIVSHNCSLVAWGIIPAFLGGFVHYMYKSADYKHKQNMREIDEYEEKNKAPSDH